MKKYPLGIQEEKRDSERKWREHPEVEQARQLNNIANELARANEGIESMKSIAEFMIKLFEKALEEKD